VGGDKKKEAEAEAGATSNNANKSSGKKKNKRRLRPLLSRQEAEQFLRLTLLAQEIDVLVDLSETVLSRRQFARRFRREVLMQSDAKSAPPAASSKDRSWKNPWLTTLGPILDVLEQRQSNPSRQQYCQFHNNNNNNNFVSNQQQNSQENILHHIHNELTRLYHGLQACGVYELERSAEQNRSLVASLTDILGFDDDGHGDDNDTNDSDNDSDSGRTSAVRKLAREKHSLSKLQDLLAKRVRSLLVVLCHSRAALTAESSTASDNGAKMDVDDDGDISNNNENNRNQILFDEQFSSTPTDGNIGNEKNPSTKKKASHEEDNDDENKAGDDDESSVLSLEEILIPLEVVCEKLFAKGDRKTTASTAMAKIQNENYSVSVSENCRDKLENDEISGCIQPTEEEKQHPLHQEKTGVHPTNNGSSLSKATATVSTSTSTSTMTMTEATGNGTILDSTAEDSDPMTRIPLEFSQRTAGAAATIMELAGKAEQEYTAPEKVTIQPDSGEDDSDPIAMMTSAETSQKTMGAADTMMALAVEAGNDFTTHKTVPSKGDPIHKSQNNRNGKVDIGVTMTNKNNPHTQQFPGNDDDSFVDDPTPSDGEDEFDETTNKENATGCKDNATSNLGIFDVVDVLTPQSQSSQQKEAQHQKEP
jgi:hypothetical protein